MFVPKPVHLLYYDGSQDSWNLINDHAFFRMCSSQTHTTSLVGFCNCSLVISDSAYYEV